MYLLPAKSCTFFSSSILIILVDKLSKDQDWQQILTTDVYSAINHLSQISTAVHHILHHLTIQQIIPPFPAPIDIYEIPDRDMAVISGWGGAEGNRDILSEEPKKRGKRKIQEQSEEEDDDQEDERLVTHFSTIPPGQFHPPPTNMRHHSLSISDRSWPPPNQGSAPLAPINHHRLSEPQLPPFRPPQHPGPVQLTPTSELDIPIPQPYYSPTILMAPPNLPPLNSNRQSITPGSIQNVTPTSLIHSSPAVEPDTMTALPDVSISQTVQEPPDETEEEVLGADDQRQTIISKKMIEAGVARNLVDQ